MPKTGDSIAGKYKIDQLIGVGGMGAVFAATHQFTGKRVALKWMLPELARDNDAVHRFMREAHAAGRINHPNVVDVYDVGQHEDSYFLVMEYLQGEPLTSALARRDMTPSEMLVLLLPAMRGVAAAHRQGVVHRDLKPDNIFLAYEEDGVRREAKVLDFGISKVTNEDNRDMRLTRTGAVVGTPYYMSPEQIRGSSGLDKRADIYAVGVILYEALSGQVPFRAETYGALVLEIATGVAQPLDQLVPGLSPDLSSVVLRAMARDVAQRYSTMEALISALEPFTVANPPRVESRLRTSGLNLDDTRIASSPLLTQSPVPQLASTPFASEASINALRKRPWVGAAMFVFAAFGIVAGVWWATREPEVTPLGPYVMPSRTSDRSDSIGAATSAPPATAPIVPAVPSAYVQPVSDARVAPTPADKREPSASKRKAEPKRWTARPSAAPSALANGPRPQTERFEPPPSAAETPSAPAAPVHRARSGTLNVNEF
jgi:serine/threonine protein kinase